ncbi:MAG: hypothetical protein ACRD3O_09870, partial [Terriglobia bacterium]
SRPPHFVLNGLRGYAYAWSSKISGFAFLVLSPFRVISGIIISLASLRSELYYFDAGKLVTITPESPITIIGIASEGSND